VACHLERVQWEHSCNGDYAVRMFECYWCKRELVWSDEHHHMTNRRDCCRDCYKDPKSTYRKIYADAASESAESKRIRMQG